MEPLPTVIKACQSLQQIEKQNQIDMNINTVPEMSAFYSQKQYQPSNLPRNQFTNQFVHKKDFTKGKMDKTDMFCDHCKRKVPKHVHQCFKHVGFPEWFPNTKGKQQPSRMSANVLDAAGILGSSPLTESISLSQGPQVNDKMVYSVYQKVLKMMRILILLSAIQINKTPPSNLQLLLHLLKLLRTIYLLFILGL